MLKIIRGILAVIVVFLSCYNLITDKYEIIPYAQLILGLIFLITGVIEIQEKQKRNAIISFLTAILVLFVSIYILLR